jgi:hypothetical protein
MGNEHTDVNKFFTHLYWGGGGGGGGVLKHPLSELFQLQFAFGGGEYSDDGL